jgi:hypothetical protein
MSNSATFFSTPLVLPNKVNKNEVFAILSSDRDLFCNMNNIFLCNETKISANCNRWHMADIYSNEYVGQIDVIEIG